MVKEIFSHLEGSWDIVGYLTITIRIAKYVSYAIISPELIIKSRQKMSYSFVKIKEYMSFYGCFPKVTLALW